MTELYHPYLQTLQSTLAVHYDLYERLTKRVVLIKNNFSTKTEYEKNEIEITIINTNRERESLKKVIDARENYFRSYIQQFAIDVKEMEENYDATLETSKQKALKNKHLDALLNSVVWDVVNTNIEAKIKLYQRLKKMIA